MSEIILNAKNFKQEIEEYQGLALVDFWASWCGPCKMMEPIIEELAKDYEGRVKVCKLQLDDKENETGNQELARKFGVSGIPALIIFQNGEKKDMITGFRPKEDISDALNKYLE